MAGKIYWTKTALLVFKEVLDYYNLKSGNDNYSKNLFKLVSDSTKSILNYKLIGIEVKNTPYRKFIIEKYSIFYKLSENNIEIVLFWSNKKNPDLLEVELKRLSNLKPD